MIEFLKTLTAQDVFRYGGPWLSGIGSISAVVVALLLARRRRVGKPRLTVLRVMRNASPYIRLDVVNTGEAPTTISGIGWRLGFPFARIHLDQLPDAVAGGDALPKELSTGQWARFYVPLGGMVESWEEVLIKTFGTGPIWCWVRSVRAEAYTADGRTIRKAIPAELRSRLGHTAKLARKKI